MSVQASPSTRRSRGPVLAAAAVGGAVLLVGGAYGVGYAMTGDTLPPNTTIEGVAVGGKTPAEAEQTLRSELEPKASAEMTVTAPDNELTRAPADLGLGVDYAASVERAHPGRTPDPRGIWENLTGGGAHEAVVTTDTATLDAALGELAQLTNSEPENAELGIEDGKPVVKESVPGRTLNVEATREEVEDAYLTQTEVGARVDGVEPEVTTQDAEQVRDEVAAPALAAPIPIKAGEKSFEVTPAMLAPALSFTVNDGALTPRVDPKTLMKGASKQFESLGLTEPQDASFTFEGGRPTIVPSKDGLGVGRDQLAKVVTDAMTKQGDQRTGSVDIAPQKAEFTTEDAEKLGIKEVTGEFTTEFPASAYRVNNIGKSAGLINGTLLKPGETFSMNDVLGPRTLARGWMAGGAIDGGQVVERMGGGISQTTTTTFNAIFFAGLEDVTHKPHSLYFSRYPMGREATLDYNSVPMKFRNDTEYGVLMQGYTNNPPVGGQGTVTIKVWSTKVYDVKASDPVVSNRRQPGPPIRNNSPVCSPQSPKEGFTVDYNRLFYKDGQLVRTEPFRWTYNTLAQVTCTNPNARPDRVER